MYLKVHKALFASKQIRLYFLYVYIWAIFLLNRYNEALRKLEILKRLKKEYEKR